MRILQICQKPPFPAVDGGCIAMNQISEILVEQGHELSILAMETYKHPRLKDTSKNNWTEKTGMETIFVDIKVHPITAFFNLFSRDSYNIQRFHNLKFKKRIEDIIADNSIDLVIFESLFTTAYLDVVKNNSGIKTVYRAHNIEHEIWSHHAYNEKNTFLKWYFNSLYKKLKRYELEVIPKFDAVATLSDHEKDFIEKIPGVKNAINIPVFYPYKQPDSPANEVATIKFFHIGSMDWKPNQEGIKWLLEEVWPNVISDSKQLIELNLAGRSMPDWLENHNQKGVTIFGEVENAEAFMDENDIMIVPLFTASGIRIKMIEAMGKNKAVLCTSVAAKGIKSKSGKNIIIADTKEEFIEAIRSIIEGKTDWKKIGISAGELIAQNHNKEQSDKQIKHLISNITEFS